MSLPTTNQVHDLFKTVRRAGAEVMSLEQQLQQAIRRDRAGSTSPDGYPRGTGGGGRSNGHSSSVETAALTLAEGRSERDLIHDYTTDACRALEDAAQALGTLRSRLASVRDLRVSDPAPKLCEHCTPRLPKPNARKVHRRGTVGDRLPKAMDLCEPCYLFAWRSTKAGSHAGQLPTGDQVAHHDRTGTWRIRVA